ncbi:MAG: hypothetical protein JXR71_05260 [Bacteroidales bacterium]|nr:hypothetical protein [Bacteroidales bacterium]
MELSNRIQAFADLGKALRGTFGKEEITGFSSVQLEAMNKLKDEVLRAKNNNGWFDEKLVQNALLALGESLREDKLKRWISAYDFHSGKEEKTVGVIMAGNVPAVGFHDFLSVLISGNKLLAKLSSDDNKLMPAIADLLISIEPEFASKIIFAEGTIKDFDAVIATGSNNTARYFDYYFGKYPNIIRKNRNGIAVLTGEETEASLKALAEDIFLYYGLGCRNVAKLYVPENYDFEPLLSVLSQYPDVDINHKYHNNYDYNKAIFLVNKKDHLDTGNLLLTESDSFASPVSVVHYEFYKDNKVLRNYLMTRQNQIQCVVSEAGFLKETVHFGKSQQPELWDYADGVDTMDFLLKL